MTVLDTDVLVDFLRDAEPVAGRIAAALADGVPLVTTAITRFELLAGAKDARQSEAVRSLLDALPTLALDEPAADRAAEVRKELESDGSGVGMADSLIAGIVLVRGGELWSRNVRHFGRVPGLRVSTPV